MRVLNVDRELMEMIRGRIKLSEVIGPFVKWDLRKSSLTRGDLWAPCPFHGEKTSSFHVDDRKGFFYCFSCHEKGDVFTFIQSKKGLTLEESVLLAAHRAGLGIRLANDREPSLGLDDLVDIKDFIVRHFSEENFLELGVKTGWSEYIMKHPRLLRSLSWGDADYPACVMELLSKMEAKKDGSIEKLHAYLDKRFSEEKHLNATTVAINQSVEHLGYRFETPRNDLISVMMPFHPSFSKVYEAIKAAAASTSLEVKRADEVWDSSVLINDILKLINHSAVVVCDLTGRNENVFYELGIAHAWGKAVIPITQNSEDVPFDLKHHRFLKYLNNSEGLNQLSEALAKRLISLVGDKPPF